LAVTALLAALLAFPAPASAQDLLDPICKETPEAAACDTSEDRELFGPDGVMTDIINILLLLVGIVSVLVIIIGGLRMVLSAGDSQAVASARNTIVYALIGLAVAFSAYALVNFVINRIFFP
jgi:hypothetical protein